MNRDIKIEMTIYADGKVVATRMSQPTDACTHVGLFFKKDDGAWFTVPAHQERLPEPTRKYHLGQKFVHCGNRYILASVSSVSVNLINVSTGHRLDDCGIPFDPQGYTDEDVKKLGLGPVNPV